MTVDIESLQALNIAIGDWDDNNGSSEDYEETRLKLEEIFNYVKWKANHIANPEHTLNYSTDMVCEECGSNEWHVNLTYNNRNAEWYYGEIDVMGAETGDDVWCHDCQGWCSLIDPEDYEEQGK